MYKPPNGMNNSQEFGYENVAMDIKTIREFISKMSEDYDSLAQSVTIIDGRVDEVADEHAKYGKLTLLEKQFYKHV